MNEVSVYASDLNWVSAQVGYGNAEKDKSPSGTAPIKLCLDGTVVDYAKGLGVHANSSVIYNIANLGFKCFKAQIGIHAPNGLETSSVKFIIKGDGNIIYESPAMLRCTSQAVCVSVEGISQIELITQYMGATNAGCHSVWADARFVSECFVYASDLDYVSAQVGHGVIGIDKSPSNTAPIKLYVDGTIVDYPKGLGAHANSSVVYDITNLGFNAFKAQIGIHAPNGTTSSSVKFIIKGNGNIIYESNSMPYQTSQTICVSVVGINEIELITEYIGSAEGCHTVWADAKFIKANCCN